jgi:hypothetical protein
MNQIGDTWNEPTKEPEENSDVDCAATDATDKHKKLHIQVVKAIVDGKWWRALSISQTNAKSAHAEELATIILQAVQKKVDRTSLGQRSNLVLAIDANRLAGMTFDSVINCAREKHGTYLAALGFRSIWIVGPSVSRTHQLDVEAPAPLQTP